LAVETWKPAQHDRRQPGGKTVARHDHAAESQRSCKEHAVGAERANACEPCRHAVSDADLGRDRAATRLLDGEVDEGREHDARNAEQQEGHPPADGMGQHPAKDQARGGPERRAEEVDAHRAAQFVALEGLREQRGAGRAAARFADADAHPCKEERPEAGREAAHRPS
jgi:hypothetical protein